MVQTKIRYIQKPNIYGNFMPQLQVGDNAPNFNLPAIDGTMFDMSAMKGKRVILTFFRFSSCPFCNIRIHRLLKRWDEFSDDVVMVGVFDANIEELSKRMKRHPPPFSVVADETYEHFLKNDVKKSLFRVLLAPFRAPLTMLEAMFRGYIPLTLSISKLSTIPVDILIDENGKVVRAHYCKDTVDHIPIDELIAFSKGVGSKA